MRLSFLRACDIDPIAQTLILYVCAGTNPPLLNTRRTTLARVTVEDCLDKVPNRFMLVHMAAKRVRQIRDGAEFVVQSDNNEDVVTALREIAAGKVYLKNKDDK